jgi:CelD/BcsL family acetyltransferase involved in cellulose biosynthesis
MLNIMVVRAGQKIIALAPLMIGAAKIHRIPIRRLQFLSNDHTPKADVIVTERTEEVFDALWNTLMKARSKWDVLLLNQLPGDSPTHDQIGRRAAQGSYSTTLWQSDASPYVELSSDWNAYLQGRNAHLKSNLRNRLNRLSKLGDVSLEVISDREAIRAAREEAMAIEASGWKHEAGTSINSDPSVKQFYTLLADRAPEQGWLRLLFLTVNGKRIATSYASRYQDRLSFFKTGYDPEYSKYAPFKLLTYFTIKDGFSSRSPRSRLSWATPSRGSSSGRRRSARTTGCSCSATTRAGWLAYNAKCRVVPALKRWLKK